MTEEEKKSTGAGEDTPLLFEAASSETDYSSVSTASSSNSLTYLLEEAQQPWPSTLQRSIDLLASSPLIGGGAHKEASFLIKSPKPGRYYETPPPFSNNRSRTDDDDFPPLQKIKSLDFTPGSSRSSLIDLEKNDFSPDNRQPNASPIDLSSLYQDGASRNKTSPSDVEKERLLLKKTKKKKKKQQCEGGEKATFWQCICNMSNTLMGIGLLGLPFVYACAGWIGGTLVFLFFTVVTWWTSVLIGRSLNGDPRPSGCFAPSNNGQQRMRAPLTSLPQIAIESFGMGGNIILSSVLYFELFSSLCIFIVTMGDHLYSLYYSRGVSPSMLMTIVSIAIAVPTVLLKTPRLLSYMSAVGTFSTIAVVLAVFVSALVYGDQTSGDTTDLTNSGSHTLWRTAGIPMATGLVAFCWAGHAIIPSFYNSMEKPHEFEQMLSYSYAIVLVCYTTVGVSGYYMFGSAVEDQITISLEKAPGASSATAGLTWLMVVTAFSKSSLFIFPLSLGVEEIIAPYLPNDLAMSVAASVVKVAMIFLALVVALFVPSFSYICALVGLICTMLVSVIFPAASHLVLFGDKLGWGEKWLDVAIVSIGTVAAIAGTIATL